MITNFKNLARNPLREKALLIAEAGYEAIDIESVISQRIKLKNNKLSIDHGAMTRHSVDLKNYKNVFVIGIGKGSALACAGLAKILSRRLTKGLALDIQPPHRFTRIRTRTNTDKKLEIFTGTHPLPSLQNVKATQEIIKLAKNAGERDLIISFICGGGSALLCSSKSELNASRTIFKELTKKGANIVELNTVRKHLSEIKGDGLAKIAYPATIISLIVSDVIGNDLSMVASGPTVNDKTTKKDAEKIWQKYQSYEAKPRKIKFLEAPKDKKYFQKVKNILFLSNREPILAMVEKAKKLGFKPKIYSLKIQGEAKKSLLPLMKAIKKNSAILAAGETTVKLGNGLKGKGGRNTEAILGAIAEISNDLLIMSFASDGRDNTEAAGALADYLTIEKSKKLNLDPQKFLDNHGSFNFFKKTGDLIFTKPKTFNVSDLMIILKQ